ncbi:hypothetical protein D3C75_1286550 [compost metagenome]
MDMHIDHPRQHILPLCINNGGVRCGLKPLAQCGDLSVLYPYIQLAHFSGQHNISISDN